MAAFMWACSDDDTTTPAEIVIDPVDQSISFGKDGGLRYVPVQFEGTLTVTTDDAEWCQVRRTGNGMKVSGVEIVLAPNERGESRSTEITLHTLDAQPLLIKITQSGADPVIEVEESTLKVDDLLEVTLTITTNSNIKFEYPEWMHPGEKPMAPATHAFTVDPMPEGELFREGTITVKGSEVEAVPVVLTVQQRGLPLVPEFAERLIPSSAVDMSFTKDGFINYGTNDAMILDAPGTEGAPASVFNETLQSYVASYPEENQNRFYKVDYMAGDAQAVTQGEFTFETYLKVTNVGQGKIVRPIASLFETEHAPGAWYAGLGFGLEIGADDIAIFRISKEGDAWPANFAGNFKVESDKYYHITFTMDKSAYPRTMRCYVNGQPTGAVSWVAWWLENVWGTQRWFGVGGNQNNENCVTEPMTGEIAYFRLYNYRLSDEQVSARYEDTMNRQSLSKIQALNKLISETIPAKIAAYPDGKFGEALNDALSLGWKLMSDLETTDQEVETFIEYTDQMFEYKQE